jgi:hypothetical protein
MQRSQTEFPMDPGLRDRHQYMRIPQATIDRTDPIMQYQLLINIDATGVSNIKSANQTVTICKQVTSWIASSSETQASRVAAGGTGMPAIAWLAFQPNTSNTITWNDSYFVYASDTPLIAGNTIVETFQKDAMIGYMYALTNGQFTASPSTTQPTSINIDNQQENSLNFGLMQQATINGISPLSPTATNCVPVLFNEEGYFYPTETVLIFLSSTQTGGTAIPFIPSGALPVTLTSQDPSVTVAFNDSTNVFYQP